MAITARPRPPSIRTAAPSSPCSRPTRRSPHRPRLPAAGQVGQHALELARRHLAGAAAAGGVLGQADVGRLGGHAARLGRVREAMPTSRPQTFRGGVSRLVTGTVLKTVVTEHLGQAGSIPVRLRQTCAAQPDLRRVRMSAPDRRRRRVPGPAQGHAPHRHRPGRPAPAGRGPTDSAPHLVKRVVSTTHDRCRAGEVAPDDVVGPPRRDLPHSPRPCAASSTPPGSSCTPTSGGRRCPPRPSRRSGRGRRRDRRRARPGDRAARASAVARRWRRWPQPCPTPAECTSSTTAPRRSPWSPAPWRAGREIVIARGELVEIGDGFRIPELLESVGAAAPRGRYDEPGPAGRLRRRGRRAAPRSCSRSTRPTSSSPASRPRSAIARARQPVRARGRGHRLGPARDRTRGCPTNRAPPRPCAPAPTS